MVRRRNSFLQLLEHFRTIDAEIVVNDLLVFLYVYVWFRATLPRLRYDQLMNLGWKVLIPISLAWFMLLAAFRLAQDEGWNRAVVGVVGLATIGLGAALLTSAIKVSARNREREGAMF